MDFSHLVDKYVSLLSEYADIKSVVLVGSAALSNSPTDIDIIIICEDEKKPKELIKSIADKLNKRFNVSDDAYRFQENEIEVSLVPKSVRSIEEKSKLILNQVSLGRDYKPWTIGGFFPEIFLSDLINSRILWEDGEKVFTKIRQKITQDLSVYLGKLSVLLEQEIHQKSEVILKAKNRNQLFINTLLNDIRIAETRLQFAQQGKLFPGLKHV